MDSCEDLQIFVPEEAEVITVLLKTLPRAILRKIVRSKPVRELTSSSEVIYISPVMIRKKDQKKIIQDKDKLLMISRKQTRAENPLTMPFVTSNRTIHRLLEELQLCRKTPNHTDTSPVELPRGSIPQFNHDAVVIYHREIFLSVTKHKPMGSQRLIPCDPNTDVPSPAIVITSDSDQDTNTEVPAPAIEITSDYDSQVPTPAIEITSASDYDSQEEIPQFLETSPEPPKDAFQKKEVMEQLLKRRCQVKLIRIPRETLNRLLAKAQMDSVSQKECHGTHEESTENCKTKNLAQQQRPPLPITSSSSEAEDEDPRPQKKQKKSVLPIASSSSEAEMEDTCQQKTVNMSENNASDSEGNAMDGNNNSVDSENNAGDCENNAGDYDNDAGDCEDMDMDDEANRLVAEPSAEVPPGLVFTAAAGPRQNCDYDQLAQEEKLSQLRAKFREQKAALFRASS